MAFLLRVSTEKMGKLAAKPDDPIVSPRTHMVEEENQCPQDCEPQNPHGGRREPMPTCCPLLSIHAVLWEHTQAHARVNNYINCHWSIVYKHGARVTGFLLMLTGQLYCLVLNPEKHECGVDQLL